MFCLRNNHIEKLIIALLFLAGTGWSAVPDSLESLLPDYQSPDGQRWNMELDHYTPDNLYEYIDGEAELYRDYGFLRAVSAYFYRPDNDLQAFTADVYDMGTALNAFGIYTRYSRPELQYGNIGTEAMISTANIRFYQDRYFVQLNVSVLDTVLAAAIQGYARKIAKLLPPGKPVTETGIFPAERIQPHTVKYITKGFLGEETFTNSFSAQCRINGEISTLFFIVFPSQDEAQKATQRFIQRNDRISITPENITLLRNPYRGFILLATAESRIYGMYDFNDQEAAVKVFSQWITQAGEK